VGASGPGRGVGVPRITMNRIPALEPTLSLGRTADRRQSLSGSFDGAGMEKLLAEAHRKFQAGFAASQQGHASAHECAQDGAEDAAGPRPPSGRASQSSRSLLPSPFAPRDGLGRLSAAAAPPPRCSSVLGLRSSERETDGRLRRSVSPGQLSLDYVDLECLLQDKMRELNVQMPKAKSSRGKHLGDLTPSSSASPTKGDGETAEFALRVKEAAFLFRLCQQEIKLQVNISCPERSRLIDKALDFWSSVLDCLVMPLDNVREQAVTLRRKLERERALLSDVAHSLGAWSKDASHLLDASVWHQLPPQEARVVADLRAQLRAFALRSCYASATRSSARSPSPPLLSRASTSRQSKSRPVSRRCADEADQDKREEATETEGAVDGDEGLTRRGQEICGMVRLVLEGLSAACRAAVQLQQDKEDLERDLELQTQEAKDAQTLARNSHAAEQRALQQQLDDALCSHAAQRQAAQEELAAAQAACTASETLNTQLQQQVATLTESVRELEERAAAAAAEGAARVDALGAEVAAAAAGRAAAEEQLREHEVPSCGGVFCAWIICESSTCERVRTRSVCCVCCVLCVCVCLHNHMYVCTFLVSASGRGASLCGFVCTYAHIHTLERMYPCTHTHM